MKYFASLLCLIATILFSSCGEDRTHEYYELIERQTWIKSVMDKYYLWYEDIPQLEEQDYFKEIDPFFRSLLSQKALNGKGDHYSYLEELNAPEPETRAVNHHSTYGMEFALFSDPLGSSTHTFARVLYVLPESPASEAGLRRGDWLSAINQEKINTSNAKLLIQGNDIRLAREELVMIDGELSWKQRDTIQMAASRKMEPSPFLVKSVYQIAGKKIAYLMYNEFTTGPLNDGAETVYNDEMVQLFQQFKAQSPDDFILDLRYNSGGYVNCAQLLGSLLAPASSLGKNFFSLQFNDQQEVSSKDYPLLPTVSQANLNLSKLYVLVSDRTASASELIINALRPYMGEENVILLGTKTEGKNVAMNQFKNEGFGFQIYPVTAYVLNSEGFYDYSEGFEPNYTINEYLLASPWEELGNVNELLLSSAIQLITTGSLPQEPSKPEVTEVKELYNSLNTRSIKGNIIDVKYE